VWYTDKRWFYSGAVLAALLMHGILLLAEIYGQETLPTNVRATHEIKVASFFIRKWCRIKLNINEISSAGEMKIFMP